MLHTCVRVPGMGVHVHYEPLITTVCQAVSLNKALTLAYRLHYDFNPFEKR